MIEQNIWALSHQKGPKIKDKKWSFVDENYYRSFK
jgi:hypothetical protein